MNALPRNKACDVEGFSRNDLAGGMRDVFDPEGRRCGAAFPSTGAGS